MNYYPNYPPYPPPPYQPTYYQPPPPPYSPYNGPGYSYMQQFDYNKGYYHYPTMQPPSSHVYIQERIMAPPVMAPPSNTVIIREDNTSMMGGSPFGGFMGLATGALFGMAIGSAFDHHSCWW